MTPVDVIDLATYGSVEQTAVDGEGERRAVDDLGLTWQDKSHHVGLIDDGSLVVRAAMDRMRDVGPAHGLVFYGPHQVRRRDGSVKDVTGCRSGCPGAGCGPER